jgi:hypothetical protein
MNADKKAQRQRLIQERLDLPDRLERAADLQRVLRAFLVGREDDIIGVYWPIKGEFDALPALYRWQEDALLGSALDSRAPEASNPLEPQILKENQPLAGIKSARSATEFIANLLNESHDALAHTCGAIGITPQDWFASGGSGSQNLAIPCLVAWLPHGKRCLRYSEAQRHGSDHAHAAARTLLGLWA